MNLESNESKAVANGQRKSNSSPTPPRPDSPAIQLRCIEPPVRGPLRTNTHARKDGKDQIADIRRGSYFSPWLMALPVTFAAVIAEEHTLSSQNHTELESTGSGLEILSPSNSTENPPQTEET